MKPPLHDKIHQLAIDIVNASANSDTEGRWRAYNLLLDVCIEHEAKPDNHPFLWETLADFTTNYHQAIAYYEKALRLAQASQDSDYIASIHFAIAGRQNEEGFSDLAYRSATEANNHAELTDDIELRNEISEFLLSCAKHA